MPLMMRSAFCGAAAGTATSPSEVGSVCKTTLISDGILVEPLIGPLLSVRVEQPKPTLGVATDAPRFGKSIGGARGLRARGRGGEADLIAGGDGAFAVEDRLLHRLEFAVVVGSRPHRLTGLCNSHD